MLRIRRPCSPSCAVWPHGAVPPAARPACFAFLAGGASVAVLLNKNQVAILTVAPVADDPDAIPPQDLLVRRVAVDVADRRVQGTLSMDMPENLRRVLDYLNRPEPFLTL